MSVSVLDIRRTDTGSVVNWGLCLRTGTLSVVDCRIYRTGIGSVVDCRL